MVGTVKRKALLILVSVSFIFVLFGCEDKEGVTIGVTQIVEHPALDRAREGFIDGLESRGYVDGDNITFDYQSAQGDINTANLIAQTFVSQKVDMIMAIATPSAQAAKNATDEIPILFSAVTDAESAGLVDSNEVPGGNVTGTSDMSPMQKQFDLIKTLFGTDQTIGVLYNTSESNSVVQVDVIEEVAVADGHTLTIKGVTNAQELTDALTLILPNVDLLLIPTDNLMASSMPIIVTKSLESGVPVIGTEKAHVEAGALITEGIDYYNLGFQTGLMAADVLEGKDISTLAVETLKETELVVNLDSAEALGITLPDALLDRATAIGGSE